MRLAIAAPSGTGKTTLVNYLKEKHKLISAKSCTTRTKREEKDDEYNFISKKKFLQLEKNDYFLETECLVDNSYGTPRHYIQLNNIIFNIDVKGVLSLKEKMNFTSIFIITPSINILKERLIQRKEENIEKRIARVKEELNYASFFDFIICNDNLNDSYNILDKIISLEQHKEKCNDIINILLNEKY